MKAYKKESILFLVPEDDLVASRIEEVRNFFILQLKENTDASEVVLDAKGVSVIDSLGVNLIIGLYKEVIFQSKTIRIINANDKFMKIANFFRFPSILSIEGEKNDR